MAGERTAFPRPDGRSDATMTRRGIFITLEGPEGSGKSTHGKRLSAWLKAQGIPVLFTREPGGTAIGQRLRKLLLDHHTREIDPLVELCLYEASRAILVREVILPALKSGRVVILDRFQDSTWVYQGWAGGMDLKLIEQLGRACTRGLVPDVTILLDLPVKKGLARVKRPNRMEAKSIAFHQKVRQGYGVLARRNRKHFRLIRTNQNADKVQQDIRKALHNVLAQYRRA